MSGFPTTLTPAGIVTRLRAAGCVFAEDEARLLIEAAHGPFELAAMVARRVDGLPLEQIVGWAEFCGLRIDVAPGVFVPRQRTEFLVRQAADLGRNILAMDGVDRLTVLDLCCGSGALGAVLATELEQVELYAADIEPAAVECARRNLARWHGQVFQGDLYQPLPAELRGRADILAANVPYVPTEEIALLPPEARVHEPRSALDGGADGLDLLRRVAAEAVHWLAPGGQLLVETSERQASLAAQVMGQHGLLPTVASCAELGATVVIGSRPTTVD
jgi:release factor glutamine methyltransferase